MITPRPASCELEGVFPIAYEHVEARLERDPDRMTIFAVYGNYQSKKPLWGGCAITVIPPEGTTLREFHQMLAWDCRMYCFIVHSFGGDSGPYPGVSTATGWLHLADESVSLCLIAGTDVHLDVEGIPLSEKPFW